MKIGLVRHFKVDYKSYNPFYYPEEFRMAMRKYDEANVFIGKTDLKEIDWEVCFSSSYKRALITAQNIFGDEFIVTDLLREVSLLPFTNLKLKLPWFVWHIGARAAWSKNGKSQAETKEGTNYRMELMFSKIIETHKENIILVTHGFFMKCFTGFLRERGFTGEIDPLPRNGQLYVFEKITESNENEMCMGRQRSALSEISR